MKHNMTNTNWNELAAAHHEAMVANGNHENYSHTRLLMWGIEEVGEANAAWRKNRRADMVGFRAGAKVPNIYEIAIKHSVEEELADIACIMMDFAATNGVKINYTIYPFEFTVSGALMKISKYITDIQGLSNVQKGDEYFEMKWSVIETAVNRTFSTLHIIAEEFGINLEEQVRLKMAHNKTREYRHGDKN